MGRPIPEIGAWFQTLEGDIFEVVAVDPDDDTIEVQFFDGTVEEYDSETWDEMVQQAVESPEDWSGSLDVSGDDYGVDLDRPAGEGYSNPLDELE